MKKFLIVLAIIVLCFVFLKNSDYFYIIKHRFLGSKDQSGQINIDLASLSTKMSENDLKSKYPAVNWDCGAENPELADRYCLCNVKKINEIESIRASFFFKKDSLCAVNIYTRQDGHNEFSQMFSKEFGDPKDLGQTDSSLNGWYMWYLKDGLIMSENAPVKNGIYCLNWISRQVAKEKYNIDLP
jgi:hypothetical protein